MNTPKRRLSVMKHILVGTLVSIAGLASIGYLLGTAAGAPQTQTLGLAFLLGLTGLGIGWIVGLVLLVLHWGLRGWATLFNRGHEQERIDQEHAAADAAYMQALDAQTFDPWAGTNPYGCCQTNYDANGVLHHGSTDCLHPAITVARV